MVALPSQQSQTIPRETYEAVRRQLQTANQKIRQLEQENQQLKAEKWQERNLRKKKDFKPAEKFTLSELQRQIESPSSHKDEQGFTRFCYTTAALNTGMSGSTPKRKIEAILEQWPDCPIETKEVEEYEDGKKTPRLYIKPKNDVNLIQAAIEANLAEERIRKQGGNKYICQHCGSVNVRIKRRLHCNCCGHETDLEDTYPNGKLKNSTSRSNLLSEDDITDDSQEESDTGETSRSNLLLADDFDGVVKNFDESLQVDDVIQKQEARQVALEADDESNNPPYSAATSTDHDSIIDEWLDIRFGTYRVIKATEKTTQNEKYTTMPESYIPDIQAFIRGEIGHIYGSQLLNSEGKTRVLCFDVDYHDPNDPDPQWLEQAQNWLVDFSHAGVVAIYWQRGQGGHFEICFDRPVHAERARYWAYSICPDLEDIAECYPCRAQAKKYLSWPMWQRRANVVNSTPAHVILPAPAAGGLQTIDPTNKQDLAQLITVAVTPAAMVEEYSKRADELFIEQKREQKREQGRDNERGGVIGLKPKQLANVGDKDLVKQVIADFCTQYSWDDIAVMAGGWHKGFFAATWRGERTASVKPDKDERYACDYGNYGNYPQKMDIYQVYCLIHNIDKKADLADRCAQLRRGEIKVVQLAANAVSTSNSVELEAPATELFATREQQQHSPVYAICIVCEEPKSVRRADGVYVCSKQCKG